MDKKTDSYWSLALSIGITIFIIAKLQTPQNWIDVIKLTGWVSFMFFFPTGPLLEIKKSILLFSLNRILLLVCFSTNLFYLVTQLIKKFKFTEDILLSILCVGYTSIYTLTEAKLKRFDKLRDNVLLVVVFLIIVFIVIFTIYRLISGFSKMS